MIRAFLILLTLASVFAAPATAQWATPIGAGQHVRVDTAHLNLRASRATRIDSSWNGRGFQTWIVVGALIGAATATIFAATKSARTDDSMMADAALAYFAGAGAVIGGVIGGFSYTVSHSGRGTDPDD